jgi:hypothetical protein
MTTEDTAVPDGGAGKSGPLPFDTSKAHQARVYDYVLGSKSDVLQTL